MEPSRQQGKELEQSYISSPRTARLNRHRRAEARRALSKNLRLQNECLQEQLSYYHLRQWNQEENAAEAAAKVKPFSAAVREVTVPDGMTHLALEAHGGKTDPKDHLLHFNARMEINAVSDAVKCRIFPSTLRGEAMDWFVALPQGSLAKFRDFSSKFLDHFSARAIEDLFDMRQRERETLEQYTKRYSSASIRFEELEPCMCVCAFKGGLSWGKFKRELSRELATSMIEVRARAQDYILEEGIEAHKRKQERAASVELARERIQEEKANRERRSKKVDRPVKKGKGEQLSRRSRRRIEANRRMRLKGHTGKELAKSLLEAGVKDVSKEGKCNTKLGREVRNRLKWCEYHNLEGHNTTDCFTLKGQIKRLIKARQPWVAKRKEAEEVESGKDEGTVETTNVIIVGGHGGDGSTSIRGEKITGETPPMEVYLAWFEDNHSDIIVSSADFEGVETHTDDPLVVMVRIRGFNMSRVLLDQGSSADIIYGNAFEQLGLGGRRPKAIHMEFGGILRKASSSARLRGTGHGFWSRRGFQTPEDKVAAGYNVIIGRNTLNRLRAVISLAHLVMKYPLPCGRVGRITIDQGGVKKCRDRSLNLYGREKDNCGHRSHENRGTEGE
ncbi:uncharacterized protein LOC130736603 [Lotus japonicus]|uniref:uncharacterized protein LOC130736603 n=1 Tax=Lotus japonicus TaxID=34305 RepID=UPI00258864D0|nr:uncharacterized protein LOC130736603 [Lotus japonicus]